MSLKRAKKAKFNWEKCSPSSRVKAYLEERSSGAYGGEGGER